MAAETHVDRSIDEPKNFIHSNILGTYNLLESILSSKQKIRLVHISTDEVYGSLGETGLFTEETAYAPNFFAIAICLFAIKGLAMEVPNK